MSRRLSEELESSYEPRYRTVHIVMVEQPHNTTLTVHVMSPNYKETSYEHFAGKTAREAIEAAFYTGSAPTQEVLFK